MDIMSRRTLSERTDAQIREVLAGRRQGVRSALLFAGPAVIASIAYMDPGNFATNIQAGSGYGYSLLWVVLMANLIAMLFQALSAKLGIVTGRNLAEVCRDQFSTPVRYAMWAVSEVAAMATDLAEFLGGAIGLSLLFQMPLISGMAVTAVVTYGILLFEGKIEHIERRNEGGWTFGRSELSGLGADDGGTMILHSQNEHLMAERDGEVVAIVTQEGQTVVAQQQAPVILKLADVSTITVKAQVSEADVIRIQPGQTAYFTILGDPDKRYYGKLRAIEPAPQNYLDTQSTLGGGATRNNTAVFYNALFDVPNDDHRLRISMTAQVNVLLGTARQALNVPVAALGKRVGPNRYGVRVLGDDGKAVTRQIVTGLNNNVRVEVREGLSAGERVVIGEAGESAPVDTSSNAGQAQ